MFSERRSNSEIKFQVLQCLHNKLRNTRTHLFVCKSISTLLLALVSTEALKGKKALQSQILKHFLSCVCDYIRGKNIFV